MTRLLSNNDCHNTEGRALDGVQSVSFSQQGSVVMTSLSAWKWRWKKGAHVWSQISLQSTARRLLSTLTTYSPDNDQATALIGALQKELNLRIQFKGKIKEIIHHIPHTQKSAKVELLTQKAP